MPREHWNDIPGDVAGGAEENLPGALGADDPDLDRDATIDEVIDNRLVTPQGHIVGSANPDATTAGASYAHGTEDGSTDDPQTLAEGETEHPGAGIGFTGEERTKQ